MVAQNIGILVVIGLSLCSTSQGSEVSHHEVSFEVLSEFIKTPDTDKFYLIDVRRPQELIDIGEIANTTINIPVTELSDSLKLSEEEFRSKFAVDKPQFDSLLIFTCRSGRRAKLAADEAARLGYWNRLVYSGSMNEWKTRNGPLAREVNY